MALFGPDYDRAYYRGGSYRTMGYDREMGYGGNRGYTGGYYGAGAGYDNTYAVGGGYDNNYKSRWETDYGDPFGDRESRTPIRMIRGEYNAYDRNYGGFDYDRGYRTMGYDRTYSNLGNERMSGTMYDRNFTATPMGYDRAYTANPASYDPYMNRNDRGTWNRGYDRGFRTYNRGGYDRGWF